MQIQGSGSGGRDRARPRRFLLRDKLVDRSTIRSRELVLLAVKLEGFLVGSEGISPWIAFGVQESHESGAVGGVERAGH